jgi:ABC-type sugar transport system ATPase subunit
MSAISKRFPGVVALEDVHLQVDASEIVGLIGENGAGKSTLMKILGGVIQPTREQLNSTAPKSSSALPEKPADAESNSFIRS